MGAWRGGRGATGQPPPTAGGRVASASLWGSLSILLATHKGLISHQTPKGQQKRYSQPSCRLTGSCTVTKRDRPTQICPFRPGQQKQAQEEQLGVATSMLKKRVVGTGHGAGPGPRAAPAAPNTAPPLLVVTQVGEYWDCGKQRSKKGDLVAGRSFPKTSWL